MPSILYENFTFRGSLGQEKRGYAGFAEYVDMVHLSLGDYRCIIEVLVSEGTHWPMSRALNKEELDTVLRAVTCMGCHQNMSQAEIWKKISTEGKLHPAKHLEMMNNMIKIMAQKGIKPAEIKP